MCESRRLNSLILDFNSLISFTRWSSCLPGKTALAKHLTRNLVRHNGISIVTICEMFCRLNVIYWDLKGLFATRGRVIYMGVIPHVK